MADKKQGAAMTLISSMKRNAKQSTSMSRFLIDQFRTIKSENLKRKATDYSVDPEITIEEFRRRFAIFKTQVIVYMLAMLVSLSLCVFGIGGLLSWVVLTYASMMYLICAREMQRAKLLLKRWDLRSTPLPLSWKRFFLIVKKNPRCLLPFGE